MPTRAAAGAEVGDESVTQILGGEIAQGCGRDEASSDRGNIVSLIMNGLHELRQRRPVTLAREALIELTRQHRPPLLWSDTGGCQPRFDVVHALQGHVGRISRVGVPVLHVGQQRLPDRRQGRVEVGADGAAALIPTRGGPGGNDSRRLEQCLILVIIDEAGGVPKSIFDAVDALATNVDARVVAVGNPDAIRHPTSPPSANRVPVGASRRSAPSTHRSTDPATAGFQLSLSQFE